MRINHVFVFLITLWLTGCATTLPQQNSAQNENMGWEARVRMLSAIQDWNINALMAIRGPKESGSVSLQWQQQQQFYHIIVFGPLGANSYELTGQPGKIELASPNGQRFVASSPEQLLAEHTGWVLPVSHLRYWIRGLPVPNRPAQKQFDAYHHLITLSQAGWTIRFLRYTSTNQVDLPSKIFLDSPQLNVKIVISQWKI